MNQNPSSTVVHHAALLDEMAKTIDDGDCFDDELYTLEVDTTHAEAMRAGAAALRQSPPPCATCQHWLGWRREGAKQPLDSTKGDCQHERLRGRIVGFDETFGCAFHQSFSDE